MTTPMPVYRLPLEPVFPPADHAEPEGLLAVGGDLSVARLLASYRGGIFPWYDEPPILWWSPDPRLVLFPEELHVSRRLRRTIDQGALTVRFDTAFADVILACAETPREGEDGTWITPEMRRAYTRLHELGIAHSAESWRDGRLVGGVYGVALGRCFFGESMFHRATDASKVALVGLVGRLRRDGYALMDCQVTTPHMLRFGAREVPRAEFLRLLAMALETPVPPGRWSEMSE